MGSSMRIALLVACVVLLADAVHCGRGRGGRGGGPSRGSRGGGGGAGGEQNQAILETCLENIPVDTALIGSEQYNATYQFQVVAPLEAAAIAFPTSEADIKDLLLCARISNTKVSVLAGQHSFVGYGFGDPGNLVINVDALDSVTVNDEDDTVTFGAGARVGPVATALWNANGHVVPHVRGSSVGMIGSYIGGGFGITSRFLGMPFDSMVSAKYMLPSGEVVTAEAGSDLLFAAQGAGSSYGVILEMTARTWEPAYQENTFVDIRSTSSASVDDLVASFLAVQEWAMTSAPELFGLRYHLGSTFRLSMFYLDDPANFDATLDSLIAAIPIEMAINEQTVGSPFDMELRSTGSNVVAPKGGVVGVRAFYLQSVTVKEAVTEAAIRALLSNVVNFDRDEHNLRIGGFMDFSGGPGSVFPSIEDEDTAMHHGDMLWLIRVDGRLLAEDEPVLGEPFRWASTNDALFQSRFTPFVDQVVADGQSVRGFANYRDRGLSFEQWSERLYGANFGRLLDIKCDVDPNNMFTNNAQSIPAQGCY